MNVVEVQDLGWRVAARTIVRDVCFSLAAGEVVAVLGPSGSGKTSLLRLLAGFEAPTAGSIRMRGETVSAAGRVRVAPERRSLALAFQDATLFPHLDAVDNVAVVLRSGPRAQRRERARAALSEMGLNEVAGRAVGSLSGGEAQRVALARALVLDDRLLLLDEPFGNVDRQTRADLIVRLRERLRRSHAAILVTHDLADALQLGARALLMHEGRVVADDHPQRMAAGDHGAWAQKFIGHALESARVDALGTLAC